MILSQMAFARGEPGGFTARDDNDPPQVVIPGYGPSLDSAFEFPFVYYSTAVYRASLATSRGESPRVPYNGPSLRAVGQAAARVLFRLERCPTEVKTHKGDGAATGRTPMSIS